MNSLKNIYFYYYLYYTTKKKKESYQKFIFKSLDI